MEIWTKALIGIVIIAAAGLFIWWFIKLPIKQQVTKVKEWLLLAVTEAERTLGDGTGQLKLRQVYDWFIDSFGVMRIFVTFNRFSQWVDEALVRMKEMLATNVAVKSHVEKEEKGNEV